MQPELLDPLLGRPSDGAIVCLVCDTVVSFCLGVTTAGALYRLAWRWHLRRRGAQATRPVNRRAIDVLDGTVLAVFVGLVRSAFSCGRDD